MNIENPLQQFNDLLSQLEPYWLPVTATTDVHCAKWWSSLYSTQTRKNEFQIRSCIPSGGRWQHWQVRHDLNWFLSIDPTHRPTYRQRQTRERDLMAIDQKTKDIAVQSANLRVSVTGFRILYFFVNKLLWGPMRPNIRNFCYHGPWPTIYWGPHFFGPTRPPLYG